MATCVERISTLVFFMCSLFAAIAAPPGGGCPPAVAALAKRHANDPVGFGCVGVALFAILLCRLELHRNLGVALLLLYVFYLVTVIHDGTTRPQRPPE